MRAKILQAFLRRHAHKKLKRGAREPLARKIRRKESSVSTMLHNKTKENDKLPNQDEEKRRIKAAASPSCGGIHRKKQKIVRRNKKRA